MRTGGEIDVESLDKRWMRASFGRAASDYDRLADFQRRVGDCLLRQLTHQPPETLTILDVGAGTGYCTRKLAASGASVIALDIASAMLCRSRTIPMLNTHHVCGDAEALPLAEQSVDIVFSNLAIQWCVALEDLFCGIFRILKPGGIFLFSSFGPDTLHELRYAWSQVDCRTHVNNFFAPRIIQTAMQSAGFSAVGFEIESLSLGYPSVLHLMRELKGLGAHNVTAGRPRGLTGKKKIRRMMKSYEKGMAGQEISATFEVLYGHSMRPNQEWNK